MFKRIISLSAAMLLMFSAICFADVQTVNRITKNDDAIYVSGNPDFYPIEYYSDTTEAFKGVMPKVLKVVSEKTGLEFKYLYQGDEAIRSERLDSGITVISAFITDAGLNEVEDSVTVFEYTVSGNPVKIGLGFKKGCDEELMSEISRAAASISPDMINGYLISECGNKNKEDAVITIFGLICVIMLIAGVFIVSGTVETSKRRIRENNMMDAETGIGNLLYFENFYTNQIPEGERSSYYIAYIILDSNYLQLYHSENSFVDAVKYVAGILNELFNENRVGARISENGFVIAVKKNSENDAKRFFEDLCDQLSRYLDDESSKSYFHIAVYNSGEEDANCGILLFNLRKNCSNLIESEEKLAFLDSHTMNSAAEYKNLIEDIERGLEYREFRMYLQFIVKTETKEIISAEGLSRWVKQDGTTVSPAVYIPALESSGLIAEFDYYMFEMACRQLHKWQDTELGPLSLSCNFTRITISEPDFCERIKEIADRYLFERRLLIMELTEDAMEVRHETATENMKKCRAMGFRVALDDMGSGYTSLVNLCDFPTDLVKIDRDILLRSGSESGKALLKGMVSLCHGLRKKVVCEGAETEEQKSFLESIDCDYIQGWYYSKAIPPAEAKEYIKAHNEKYGIRK